MGYPFALADPALTLDVARYGKKVKAHGVNIITMSNQLYDSLINEYNAGDPRSREWLARFLILTKEGSVSGSVSDKFKRCPWDALEVKFLRKASEDEYGNAGDRGMMLLEPVDSTSLQNVAKKFKRAADSRPKPLLGMGQNILKATFLPPLLTDVAKTFPALESPTVQEYEPSRCARFGASATGYL